MFPKVRPEPEQNTSWAEVSRGMRIKKKKSNQAWTVWFPAATARAGNISVLDIYICIYLFIYFSVITIASWTRQIYNSSAHMQRCGHVKRAITGKKPHRAFQFLKVTRMINVRYLEASKWLELVLVIWGQSYSFPFIRLLWIYPRGGIKL